MMRVETFVIGIAPLSAPLRAGADQFALAGEFLHPRRLLGATVTIYVAARPISDVARASDEMLFVEAASRTGGQWRLWTRTPSAALFGVAQAFLEGRLDLVIAKGAGFSRRGGVPRLLTLHNKVRYAECVLGAARSTTKHAER